VFSNLSLCRQTTKFDVFGEAMKKAEGNKEKGLEGIHWMCDERGYLGEPFARPAETGAQKGASQLNLQCLKVAKLILGRNRRERQQ
jgi:hypothetical protein